LDNILALDPDPLFLKGNEELESFG